MPTSPLPDNNEKPDTPPDATHDATPEEAVTSPEGVEADAVAAAELAEPAAAESGESSESTESGEKHRRGNALTQVPPVIWLLVVLLMIISALLGYIAGTHHAPASDSAASNAASSSASASGEQPENPYADSAVEAMSTEEIAKLKEKVEPGRAPLEPQGKAGEFDATINGPAAEVKGPADILNVARRDAADPFAYGAVDAPVVISEFSDFECPFCSRYANATEPEIIDAYVKKGLVRIEWNDLAINGPHAVEAAKAGRAAAAQNKFFAFKHALYEASKDINGHPEFERDDFIRFATEAGVPDIDAFTKALDSEEIAQAVDQAVAYGSSLGISGTPSFVVGTRFISGAQPLETFTSVIDTELAKVAAGEVKPTR